MGDFNAKIGQEWTDWENVMGHYGYGTSNARGEKLLNFCAVNNLFVTNTMFKQTKDSRQWTWESPDQKTHNKIDFILIKNTWKNCVNNSRSFPSADIGSDHQLIIANIHLRFKPKSKPKFLKRYDVFKLKKSRQQSKV